MPKSYKTVLGDTWDLIAFKTFGNERYANRIIESNLQHKGVVIFSAGIDLIIPDIETPSETGLPPWKRR